MNERVSRLGVYSGYGDEGLADGYDRESLYVTLEDGCRIAVDVLRPARRGERLDGAFPTVLHATPYRRAFIYTGKSKTAARYLEALAHLEVGDLATQYEERPLARDLIHRGYNFVSMDLRGTGASFGADYVDSWRTGHDIAQVVEWIASQPWSTDKIGMVGISYEGMVQCYTAAFAPKSLACIAPQYPGLPQCYVDGGLAISSFARTWESLHKGMAELEPAAPVDGPDGLRLREEAEAERNPDRYRWIEAFSQMDPRNVTNVARFDGLEREVDRSDLGIGTVRAGYTSAHGLINASGVPTYLVTGWWDLTFAPYLIDFFNRLTVPRKLLMGPWNHGQGGDPELLRWFDRWLKTIDNGIMDEPTVHYGASEPSGRIVWKGAPRLPLPEARPRVLYLVPERSTTIASANDGSLSATVPSERTEVEYDVDHDVTLGTMSRHSYYTEDLYINALDLQARGERCLTFTTESLDRDVEITGAPALDLEIATSLDRGAIVATLEHVLADGSVAYLTEGFLNFAHRKTADAEFGHDGAYWHRWLREDLLPVRPGEPMSVRFELYPVSCIARAGDRLRLTLAGADADNLIVPTIGDEATLRVTQGGERASRLLLPIVNPHVAPTARVVPDGFDAEFPGFAFRRGEDPPFGS
ncbi:MAG: CocE/NonD family hydrolase [Holophagales bacterium]|nr:CocE/NonD family hydrolase [Holophagales bacterium]MYG32025.1 CocE/NonD family hydrolase [Holophagales bacterium]MYI80449.1 CocE/NonD family hydrolase [Holophagales bacterium]